MVDFPYVPKPYLRTQLIEHRFYAPTHLLLAQHRDPLPYLRKSVPSRVSGKGKAKHDVEFEAERRWLLQKLDAPVSTDGARPEESNDDACEECEDGIECGCCFSSYPFVCCFPRLLDNYSNIVIRTRWCSVQKRIYSAKVACLPTHPTFWASTIPISSAWISLDAKVSFRSPSWNGS